MITEDYVSFEVAKLLKEKGFDAECRAAYTNYGQLFTTQIQQYITNVVSSKGTLWDCIAPTHQMVMKWLREVHNLFIEPYVIKNYSKKKLEYTYSIQDLDFQGSDDGIECCKNWDTPEQACETAIKYCLEHLI